MVGLAAPESELGQATQGAGLGGGGAGQLPQKVRDQGGAGALKIVIIKAHRLPELSRRSQGRTMAQHPKGVVHRRAWVLGMKKARGEEGAEK